MPDTSEKSGHLSLEAAVAELIAAVEEDYNPHQSRGARTRRAITALAPLIAADAYLRVMVSTFVKEHAWRAELDWFTPRGPLQTGAAWVCEHAHPTYEEAIECGDQELGRRA